MKLLSILHYVKLKSPGKPGLGRLFLKKNIDYEKETEKLKVTKWRFVSV